MILFALVCALVALLIPFPGLLPFSLVGLALIWLATPTQPSNRRRRSRVRGDGSGF